MKRGDIMSTIEYQKAMKAIADTNKRMNEVERKLDSFFGALHEKNAADIGYVAMMTDVELDDEEDGDTDE